jgi:hypothetical protein
MTLSTVAWEMARQLHAQGEQVALLVLIDAHYRGHERYLPDPRPGRTAFDSLLSRVDYHIGNLIARDRKEQVDYLAALVKNRIRMIREQLPLPLGVISSQDALSPVVRRVWDQMPDPKWCISMGACSSVGGPFNTYAVLQGVDRIVPVDVYVVGCPPRPEGLFYALLKLQDKIDQMSLAKRPTEVRLRPEMVDQFKRGVMVAQTPSPR